MVGRLTILLFLLLCLGQIGLSQKHLFSEVEIRKSSAYVGEPIEVVVSAYTSTWFTKGVDLGNIKVSGAFTVYFRSVSNSLKIDGQTYAGVKLHYYVFPYEDNDLEFPALQINVETPDMGDFKGKSRTLNTEAQTIKIKARPDGIDQSQWLVTSNLSVKERWSKDKKNVKVGDVLTRTIDRKASNTISELIPPVVWDSIGHVSLYPIRASVETLKTKTSINANRTDGTRYLFEKEGEVEIPELVFTWWNPEDKQLYKRTLPGYTINVLPNPDLGMLATLQDSLANASVNEFDSVEANSNEIWGLTWWQLLTGILLAVFVLYYFIKYFKLLKTYFEDRRAAYLLSEKYFFELFIKALNKKDSDQVLTSLYRWLDEIPSEVPTATNFARTYGSPELMNELIAYQSNTHQVDMNAGLWRTARKNYVLTVKSQSTNSGSVWVNP